MVREQQQVNDKPEIKDQQKITENSTQDAAQMPKRSANEFQKLLAEVLGTFALTFVSGGGIIINTLTHGEVALVAHYVAAGLIIMAMIYTLGSTSGAHFNPTVTLAFALRRDFPWRRVPGYWLAQILGAIVAALLLRLLFGDIEQLGATLPKHGAVESCIVEVILTFFLITVVLALFCQIGMVAWTTFMIPVSAAKPVRKYGISKTRSQGKSKQEQTYGWRTNRKVFKVFFHP